MKKDLFSGLSKKNFDLKKFKELKRILSKQGIVIKRKPFSNINFRFDRKGKSYFPNVIVTKDRLSYRKVKQVVPLFDYLHSLDNYKLAKKIHDEETKNDKKIKIFIQINLGLEEQKSGINSKI